MKRINNWQHDAIPAGHNSLHISRHLKLSKLINSVYFHIILHYHSLLLEIIYINGNGRCEANASNLLLGQMLQDITMESGDMIRITVTRLPLWKTGKSYLMQFIV